MDLYIHPRHLTQPKERLRARVGIKLVIYRQTDSFEGVL
jgi:hypothetical protein